MPERKPFLLRLPPDLMDALNVWARDELRSLNAQIEYVLRDAVRRRAWKKMEDEMTPESTDPDDAS